MKIKKIELLKINLEFKEFFKHSLAARNESTSIILKITSENYIVGYGESIAREYLTGETTESMIKELKRFLRKMRKEFKSLEDIKKYIKKAKLNPAAKCCVDIALLDLGSQYFKEPILEPKVNKVYYSAPVSLSSGIILAIKLFQIKFFRIKKVKIKLDSNIIENEKRLKIARLILGENIEIGVDANGSWNEEDFMRMIPILEKYKIYFCEQPLPKEALFKKDLQNLTKIPIMADESFTSLSDAKNLLKNNSVKILNIRLAKLGGILAAQEAIDFARKNNSEYQIGCLVGESGILSACGRILASHNPDAISIEGSYSRYLLKKDIIKQDISFEKYGKAPVLSGLNSNFGIGIEVNAEILKNNSVLLLEK